MSSWLISSSNCSHFVATPNFVSHTPTFTRCQLSQPVVSEKWLLAVVCAGGAFSPPHSRLVPEHYRCDEPRVKERTAWPERLHLHGLRVSDTMESRPSVGGPSLMLPRLLGKTEGLDSPGQQRTMGPLSPGGRAVLLRGVSWVSTVHVP